MSALELEDPVWEKNYKDAKVKLSCGTIITGKINIREFPRLSDMMKNTYESYIVVVDVSSESEKPLTYIINKQYVVWVETKS